MINDLSFLSFHPQTIPLCFLNSIDCHYHRMTVISVVEIDRLLLLAVVVVVAVVAAAHQVTVVEQDRDLLMLLHWTKDTELEKKMLFDLLDCKVQLLL